MSQLDSDSTCSSADTENSTMCDIHKRKSMTSYCKLHHVFLCMECLLSDHRNCIQHIESIEETLEKAEHISTNILSTFEKLQSNVSDWRNRKTRVFEDFEKTELRLIKGIKQMRLKLIELVNKKATESMEVIGSIMNDQKDIVKADLDALDKISEKLVPIQRDMATLYDISEPFDVFFALKLHDEIEVLQNEYDGRNLCHKEVNIHFYLSPEMTTFKDNFKSFGQLSVEDVVEQMKSMYISPQTMTRVSTIPSDMEELAEHDDTCGRGSLFLHETVNPPPCEQSEEHDRYSRIDINSDKPDDTNEPPPLPSAESRQDLRISLSGHCSPIFENYHEESLPKTVPSCAGRSESFRNHETISYFDEGSCGTQRSKVSNDIESMFSISEMKSDARPYVYRSLERSKSRLSERPNSSDSSKAIPKIPPRRSYSRMSVASERSKPENPLLTAKMSQMSKSESKINFNTLSSMKKFHRSAYHIGTRKPDVVTRSAAAKDAMNGHDKPGNQKSCYTEQVGGAHDQSNFEDGANDSGGSGGSMRDSGIMISGGHDTSLSDVPAPPPVAHTSKVIPPYHVQNLLKIDGEGNESQNKDTTEKDKVKKGNVSNIRAVSDPFLNANKVGTLPFKSENYEEERLDSDDFGLSTREIIEHSLEKKSSSASASSSRVQHLGPEEGREAFVEDSRTWDAPVPNGFEIQMVKGEIGIYAESFKGKDPNFTGLTLLGNGGMILCDYNGDQILLVNKNGFLLDTFNTSKPFGCCIMRDGCVAVTTKGRNSVNLFTVSGTKLKRFKENPIDEDVFGISYSCGFLCVSCSDKIKILTENLDTYATVNAYALMKKPRRSWSKKSTTPDRKSFFVDVQYSALEWSTAGFFMYASDVKKERVVCVDINGTIKWNQVLFSPKDIVYHQGGLLVATKKKIVLIEARNGLYIREIQTGIPKYPVALSLNEAAGRLFMTEGSNKNRKLSYVSIYQDL